MTHGKARRSDTSLSREKMRQRRRTKKMLEKCLWWTMVSIAAFIVLLVYLAYVVDR